MAGLGKSRGSKSTSGSKSVGERIKAAREKGLGSNKSSKKDTAISGTKRNYGGAKPRRVGQGGTTTITESVDNLIGGKFTKKSGPRRATREEVLEARKKRQEQKRGAGPRRVSREELLEARKNKMTESSNSGKTIGGRKDLVEARKKKEEQEARSGKRMRPSSVGIGRKGGPKRPGNGVTDTTPADRGRGPRPGGNVGPDGRGPKRAPRGPGQTGGNVGPGGRGPSRTDGGTPTTGGRGPKAGIGRGGKSGVGRGPKAGGNQIGNRGGGAKPGRGQGPKRNIGQTGGNVGPGGAGPNRTGGFDTVYFM